VREDVMGRTRLLILVAACVALLSACGSSKENEARSREAALKRGLGLLHGADVRCTKNECAVIAPFRLSSAYTALLVVAPVVEKAVTDPDLDEVETINVTLDDASSGQVFSLRCETDKLGEAPTVEDLRDSCHSIFT
jgi:hypothetical protein